MNLRTRIARVVGRPVIDKARREGCQARVDNRQRTENPYTPGTIEHDSWDLGWKQAYEENS